MTIRHRNNVAEWVMWALLLPAVPVVWAWERARFLGKHMKRSAP